MTDPNFFSTSFYHEETTDQSNGLGPWVENRYRTIDLSPKIMMQRHHIVTRKPKKINTAMKLPVIASKVLQLNPLLMLKETPPLLSSRTN